MRNYCFTDNATGIIYIVGIKIQTITLDKKWKLHKESFRIHDDFLHFHCSISPTISMIVLHNYYHLNSFGESGFFSNFSTFFSLFKKIMLSFFDLFTAFMFTAMFMTQSIHKFFLLCKKLPSISRWAPNCTNRILTKIANNISVEKTILIQRKDTLFVNVNMFE